MKQRGISFLLNSQITTIAIVIIASIVYINYYFTRDVLVKKIEDGAVNQSNMVISRISRITVGTEEIAKNVSAQALYYYKNNDLNSFLQQVLKSNEIIESIHIELTDVKKQGLVKFSSNKRAQIICNPDSLSAEKFIFDLQTGHVKLNQGIWSTPFFCKYDTAHLLVSYKMPIYYHDSQNVAGVVSCEVSLKKMQQRLSNIQIGEHGYAFIIDQTGNFISHPRKDWVLKGNLYERPSTIFKERGEEIVSRIKQGRSGAGLGISEYLNNVAAWYYYAPITDSGWSVIIVVPEKELFSEIDGIFQKIIFVSVFGILTLFLVNFFVFRRMLDPLVRITHAIQRFSSAPGKERQSKNEINMLAESLEDWQEKYGLLIKDQSKTASDKIKFDKDLKSAQEIQLNIVPSGKPNFPEYPEIDLYAMLKPAETIGGDLYDYFFIDKNHLLVAIGDVSGKGIPASLFMAITSTLIKTHAKILSSKDIVGRVNKELSDRNSNQYFVTLFLGVIDIRSGILDYCNAAHNYPYILRADGSLQTLSKSHGLPLGIYKDKKYKSSKLELSLNDMMILYTDGVINSRDSNKQHYGTERLENNIQNLNDLTAEEVVKRLVKSIVIFEEGHQADDISLLALKFLNETKNQA
jgi:phosphoserine phosphatase RsbU/P